MALTLRDVVNVTLHMLEIGQVDGHGDLVWYVFRGPTKDLPLADQLVFRTIERSVHWLKKHEHYGFNQELTDDDIQLIYNTFRSQVVRATLPTIDDDASIEEIRQQAIERLEGVIKQHERFRFLLHQREVQPNR